MTLKKPIDPNLAKEMPMKFPRKAQKQDLRLKPIQNTQPMHPEKMQLSAKLPKIALVGHTMSANEVAMMAKKIGIKCDRYPYIKDLKKGFTGQEAGIFYVLPLRRGEIVSIHNNLIKSKRFQGVPCFAIAPEWITGATERKMYKAGIRMIFEWPKDQSSFSTLLTGIVTVGTRKVKSYDEDKALISAVKNRILAENGKLMPDVSLTSYHGIILLQGEVPSIDAKRQMTKLVKSVPGVRGVLDVSLKVKPVRSSASDMKKRARNALKRIPGLDPKTVQIEMQRGSLVITGNVPTVAMRHRILSEMESLRGLTRINDFLVISKRGYEKDKGLAQRASRIAKKASLTKAKNIRVKVTNGAARLLGTVTHPLDKSHIENVLKTIDGIKKVDNRLAVTSV